MKSKSKCLLLLSSEIKRLLAKPRELAKSGRSGVIKLILFALLFIYAFGAIAVMPFELTYILCGVGCGGEALALFVLAPSVLTALTACLSGGKAIYAPRDYDFIMSLPIKDGVAVGAKAAALYVYDFLFCVIIFVPSAAAYAVVMHPCVLFYVLAVLTLILIPAIPTAIGGFISIIVAYVSSRMKHKNAVTVVLSLVFAIGIVVLSGMTGGLAADDEAIANMAGMISDKVEKAYFPAVLAGNGLDDGDVLSFAGFAAISVAALALYLAVTVKYYRRLHDFVTATSVKGAKKASKNDALVSRSVGKTLFIREWKHYASIPAYVVNTIIGPIMLLGLAIGAAFVPLGDVFSEGGGEFPYLSLIYRFLPVVLSFPVMMTSVTASSISLEGGSRYILKSAPVGNKSIYGAKIKLNLLLLLPAVAASGVIIAARAQALGIDAITVASVFVMPGALSVFVSVFGLWCNLRHQNYNWKNEVTVVKQSLPVAVTILGGMGLVIALAVGVYFTAVSEIGWLYGAFTAAIAAVSLALSAVIYKASLKIDIE